ncbi:MAG: hypothetical protein ACREV5_01780 [Steroidobacter sp.]
MKTKDFTPSSTGERDPWARVASTLALLCSAAAATLSLAPPTAAASEGPAAPLPPSRNYEVHHLTLNGAGCKVAGIDAGAAVGTCNTPDGASVRAFIWMEATGVVDIGTLGGSSAGAGAIDAGRVGGSSDIAGDMETHAYSWTAQEGMLDLGTLGGTFAGVSSVSGEALVGDSTTVAGHVHAFSWTPATGMIDLGTLAAGTESAAADIHNGLIAGFSATDGFSGRRPVAWKTDGQMIDIIGEPIGASENGQAMAVRNGLVVGFRRIATLETRAFAWREEQGLMDLGLVPGSNESFAFDTDGDRVVGQLSGVGGPTGTTARAFVWTKKKGMTAITPASITARATHVVNGRVLGVYHTPETNGTRVFLWTQRRGLVDVTPRDFPGGFAPAGIDAEGRIAILFEDEDPANTRSAVLIPR